ncbi:MAG: nucleotidyl transferase AbiEii/AbiGii toxin family protein [Opitutales bacterium]|nr:nucleotidyl transferase AbiEii/AbiGii toxin family protein [Opitutales bacterium]
MKLHTEAVDLVLWNLLLDLMATGPLRDFNLAGGTALGLLYGHRTSVDLDLFSDQAFDAPKLGTFLTERFGLAESSIESNSVTGVIRGIRVDCIAHRYPMIAEPQHRDGIRLLAVEDIAAMKLNAIANRGSKKDFWDLYELMQHFDRPQLLGFFKQKYPSANLWTVEKSLLWFDDADMDPDPRCLKGRSWMQIRDAIAEWNRL